MQHESKYFCNCLDYCTISSIEIKVIYYMCACAHACGSVEGEVTEGVFKCM